MHLRLLFACLIGVAVAAASDTSFADAKKKIYLVSFQAWDPVAEGVKAGFEQSGLDTEILFRDTSQKKDVFPTLVAEARSLHVDLVVTIGTSATVGMTGVLSDVGSGKYLEDIPVVFTL